MSVREFIHQTLLNDDALEIVHQGRVFQGQSVRTAYLETPFLVHRFGNDSPENIAEVDIEPHRQFFSIWVYDELGDYTRIDDTIAKVKASLSALLKSKTDKIITIRYLETSQDLEDQTFNAICRYARFQLIMS